MIIYLSMLTTTFIIFISVFKNQNQKISLYFIFLYHTIFSIIFLSLFIEAGSDFSYYFEQATLDESEPFGFGTKFIIYLTRIFSLGGTLGIWEVSLLYNLLGSIGLGYLYVHLKELTYAQKGIRAAFPAIVVLLPGLSFWTSAIGKDSLSFFAISAIILSISATRRHMAMFILGTTLLFLVRPHVGTAMIAAVFVAGLTSRAIPLRYKALILIGGTAAAYWILPQALAYVGLPSSTSVADLAQYIGERQEQNQGQGASFDVSSQPFVIAVFSFLFRPLFEVEGIAGIMASLENLVLIAIVVTLTIPALLGMFKKPTFEARANLMFVVFMLAMLAPVTANSGIAVRQKMMILPSIFVLTALGMSRRRSSDRHVEHQTQGIPKIV